MKLFSDADDTALLMALLDRCLADAQVRFDHPTARERWGAAPSASR